MKAIVLTFERLPLAFLGCYGNLRVRTPHFDRLAAESLVFDQHFGEDFSPGAKEHAWATGAYGFPMKPQAGPRGRSLADFLHEAGVRSELLREKLDEAFPLPTLDRETLVEGRDGLDADPAEIPFAQLTAAGLDALAELQSGGDERWLLWLHSRGVPRPWLPPREPALLYVEASEEEEGGDSEAESLDELLRAAAEPQGTEGDWRIARAVYAGYVTLLDHWLGELLDGIGNVLEDEPHLLIVTAAEGESLGERAELPASEARLHEEIVHTPLFVRFTGGLRGEREAGLVQTVDLPATLLDFYGVAAEVLDGRSLLPAARGEQWVERGSAFMGSGPETHAMRTAEYCLIRTGEPAGTKLYLKPEDVWEVLDISEQWPQLVEEGLGRLEEFLGRG